MRADFLKCHHIHIEAMPLPNTDIKQLIERESSCVILKPCNSSSDIIEQVTLTEVMCWFYSMLQAARLFPYLQSMIPQLVLCKFFHARPGHQQARVE